MLDLPTALATFLAGMASFLAPCTVPLLPAYIAYAGGVTTADLAAPERRGEVRGRLVAGTVLFVLGFVAVFVLLGIGAGGVGRGVRALGRPVEIAGGVLLVAVGLTLLGLPRLAPLMRERRPRLPERLRARGGLLAAAPLGVVFGIGWTPCVGPYLGSALGLAAASEHAGSGAVLLLAYGLGLGLPFVVAAVAVASLPDATRLLSRVAGPLARVGAAALVALGVLLVSGQYGRLTSWLAQLGTPV